MPTVKALRESRGWSQQQLAEKAGVSISTLWNVENEATSPNRSTLRLLAVALGINPDELIAFYQQKNKPTGE